MFLPLISEIPHPTPTRTHTLTPVLHPSLDFDLDSCYHCTLINKIQLNWNQNIKPFFWKTQLEILFAKCPAQCIDPSTLWKMVISCKQHLQMHFIDMMTSWNGNIFRVTGPLCGEFTGDRWIPLTEAGDQVTRSFDVVFHLRLNKQWGWWFGTPLCSLWRHDNEKTSAI